MNFKGKFFSKLFKGHEDYFNDLALDERKEEEFNWDWDHIIEEKHLFRMSDELQRERYLRSLVEQVKDASTELDKLSGEYNLVTANLKDMDEIDALPFEEKSELMDSARKILFYESETKEYDTKKSLMTDAQYHAMERFEDKMPKAYEDIKASEELKDVIKEDLRKLEAEKHAYLYRQAELKRDIVNLRGMVIICVFAAILCVLMLLILQYGFEMETKIGYIITVFAVAIAITFVFVKHQDSNRELSKVYRGINRIILLQNTVKIRYVNNANLLDYLCAKYNTKGSKELWKIWEAYLEEKQLRDKQAFNEQEMSFYQTDLLKKLRRYQLSDVYAWLNNPRAILEKNEMVELRHAHIIQRQKLRARMDYNKRLAKEGQKELKEFVKKYPEYSREAMDMLERYS